ncbi:MAG: DUF3574 domain-containing protein [Selenomonadaceae bacterium]|nr:DUF3574 domain-containing protein [Selenomonadaceae bacterium]
MTKNLLAIVFGIFLSLILFVGTGDAAKNDISSLGSPVSKQEKFTLYLGTNDKDTLKQEIPTETIREQMHEICIKYVDGYTVWAVDGYYRDDGGNIIHERSLVYVFIDTPIDSIKKIMDAALIKFNQESILLEDSKGRSVFYRGNKR